MTASSNKSERLGFIGVGAMGLPMVDRLVAAGHRPVVWDLSLQRLDAASHVGADVAGSAAEVARSAAIVFLCLTDASAVETVALDVGGLSSAIRSGGIVVDFSSIPPDRTRAIAARLKAANGMSWSTLLSQAALPVRKTALSQ